MALRLKPDLRRGPLQPRPPAPPGRPVRRGPGGTSPRPRAGLAAARLALSLGEWVRDAERMAALDARLPAVLKGDDHPADAAEGLTFAQLCTDRKLHAAAARLYAEALQADPKLGRRSPGPAPPTTPPAPPRWPAAAKGRTTLRPMRPREPSCAARPSTGSRPSWRPGPRSSRTASPTARATVRLVLEHWKADPDLAGVRDEAELAKLPEAERQAWHALWAEVEALLKKAQGDRP